MHFRYKPSYERVAEYNPKFLHKGVFPAMTEAICVEAGQNLTYGSVIGRVKESRKFKFCDPQASDGSEVPYGILTEDVDASKRDEATVVYITGDFNSNYLVCHEGWKERQQELKDKLRQHSIFIESGVAAYTPEVSV